MVMQFRAVDCLSPGLQSVAPVTVRFRRAAERPHIRRRNVLAPQDRFHRINCKRSATRKTECTVIPGTYAEMEAEWREGWLPLETNCESGRKAPRGV